MVVFNDMANSEKVSSIAEYGDISGQAVNNRLIGIWK